MAVDMIARGMAASALGGSVTPEQVARIIKEQAMTPTVLNDGSMTIEEIIELLRQINEDGEHVLFDTAALSAQMYLTTIYIDDYDAPSLWRINDLVTGKFAVGTYSAGLTLDKMLENAMADYVEIVVTCTTNDGVLVNGQIVTVRSGDSASDPVYATAPYDGQPVTFFVPRAFTYHVSVSDTLSGHFAPNTASGIAMGLTSVTLTYADASHILTFDQLVSAMETLPEPTVLVGNVEIADTWKSDTNVEYSNPLILTSVQNVEDPDGNTHLAAIMQRKWASLDALQFDAPENEIATETTATTGLYYVGKNGTTYTQLNLASGETIPYDDYEAVYHNGVPGYDGNMVQYGYNRWRDSFYRKYLNTDEPAGQWGTASHIGDVVSTFAASHRGYMAGCSAALLAAAKPIKIKTSCNTITDGGATDTTVDTFWLPSGIEMYGTVNAGDGVFFPYWKAATGLSSPANDANNGRIQYALENHTSAQSVRLRSCNRYNSSSVYNCYTSGQVNASSANNSFRACPACAIY